MKLAVEKGAEFFLERELHRQGDRYEPWYRFHYPVHYYYDLLVGLDFMTALGYSDDKRLGYASLCSRRREGQTEDGTLTLCILTPKALRAGGTANIRGRRQLPLPSRSLGIRAGLLR